MKDRKKRLRWTALLLAIVLLCLGGVLLLERRSAPAFARMEEQTLIIDPGHGGEDGGAVSVSGQLESEINLSIALQLDQLMGFYGVHTVLTREGDVSIHDQDAETLREKKVSDLHNRAALINTTENATLISIHQNSYPNQRYHGTQVFYGDGAGSQALARKIQETIHTTLDPENARKPQHIQSSVYLMNHITCRAVLTECGFLSNPEEDRLLQEKAYQMKLAMVLGACYVCSEETEEGGALI